MAAHSNRSPSPLSSKPSNPKPRNSESSNSATRRSFTGNNNISHVKPSLLTNPRRFDPVVTPANSPSDFARRCSLGKESIISAVGDCNEKENEKDLNSRPSKLKSPAKCSKNFMSPTISAASKFTPSPKNKILVERNDPVRTSMTFSDGKAIFFSSINASQELDSNVGTGCEKNPTKNSLELNVTGKKEPVLEAPLVSKPPKRVTFLNLPSNSNPAYESFSESVVTESDLNLKCESATKNDVSHPSASSPIASLDADPFLPPYDPKTNYLSPRPQFLHFKPNPRIEILLNKERDPDGLKRLEDSFLSEIMSEDFSDSEGGTEESQGEEDSHEEETEVNDYGDMVLGLEEADEDAHVSEHLEPLPAIPAVRDAVATENLVQKREKKRWGFSKLICFSMLLMFFIGACISVSFTRPVSLDQFVDFSDLSNYCTAVSFEKLARQVNQFSANSMDLISKLINKPGDGKILGSLKFVNLTDPQMNIWDEGNFLNDHSGKLLLENLEEDEMEQDYEEDPLAEIDSDESSEQETVENLNENELADDGVTESEAEPYAEVFYDEKESEIEAISLGSVLDAELEPESSGSVERTAAKLQEKEIKVEAEMVEAVILQDQEIKVVTEMVEAVILQDQEIKVEAEMVEAMAETITDAVEFEGDKLTTVDHKRPVDISSSTESSFTSESPTGKTGNKLVQYIIGASSFLAVLLLPVVAFLYRQKKNSSSSNVVVLQPNPSLCKQEKLVSQNWQMEVEESCPSEMSSSFNSAFYSNKEVKGETEAQSFGGTNSRRYSKRESLASSTEFSTGSLSYGSFTTFERIPIKHGDDEIITPVRRSSRIKKQVTST